MALTFIVGQQRGGTSVLRDLIARSGILDAGEIFSGFWGPPHRFFEYAYRRIMEEPVLLNPLQQLGLLYEFMNELQDGAANSHAVIDCKYLHLYLFSPSLTLDRKPAILQLAEDFGAGIIHLDRRNKLRVYLSLKVAERTEVWSARTAQDVPFNRLGQRLDVSALVPALAKMEQDREHVEMLLHGYPKRQDLAYEDMFDGDGNFTVDATDKIGAIVGRPVDRRPGYARMNPEPLVQLISNYREVEQALESTPFAWMLDERA